MSAKPSLGDLNDLLSGVNHARSVLPMPALMRKLGLGDFINTHGNCECPFCWAKAAFSLRENSDGTWCFDCNECGGGDEVALLQKHLDNNIAWPEAAWHYAEIASAANVPIEIKQSTKTAKDLPNGATTSELNQRFSESLPSESTELGRLLYGICRFLCRYVTFQCREQPIVIALWIVHTWTIKAFDYTPYLNVFAAAKRSGKSRLLEVLDLVCRNPRLTSGGSSAALIRTINEANPPTILLDEIDAIYAKKNDGEAESTRQFLNAGFRRGAKFLRCVGQGAALEPKEFAAFSAKAFAGIGRSLPDTVLDRNIPIELQRQLREEKAERLRRRDAEAAAVPIRASLDELSQRAELVETLRDARPVLPEQLSDRQQDICEPLLAIGDMASGHWQKDATAALIKLCTQEEDVSNGIKLLSDIRSVFDSKYADKLTTREILEELIGIDDSPWAGWWADDLKHDNLPKAASKLARMLSDYKTPAGKRIKPHTLRMGKETPKGFYRIDFEDAWERYLPAPSETAATPATTATCDRGNVAAVADVAVSQDRNGGKPATRAENDGHMHECATDEGFEL